MKGETSTMSSDQKTRKCECPEQADGSAMAYLYAPEERAGMVHEPNRCAGTYDLARYRRADETIAVLCSCCCMSSDERLGSA